MGVKLLHLLYSSMCIGFLELSKSAVDDKLLFLKCEKITKMLQQNGCRIKIIQNIICKAIHRSQNPDAKLCPNQQESTKHCVYSKLQFIGPEIPKQNRYAKLRFSACDFMQTANSIQLHTRYAMGSRMGGNVPLPLGVHFEFLKGTLQPVLKL